MTSAGLYTFDEVYRLLPEIYRVRDVEHDEVLRELVEVITDQMNVIAESLEQMYDDQFVETASDWVLPYIGDLIGYRTLHGEVPEVASPRAEVANTIRYRRRKGTASMLEQLARDVTGWPARAVEFFELLTTTQYMNHLRDHAEATADLGGASRLEIGGDFVSGAFDRLSHTAEVRRISTRSGRYNIPNIGLFLWRLRATRLTRAPLVEADGSGRRYRFDPFGADRPIFALPRTETEISHLAEPRDVPNPLTRRWLSSNLDDYYGPGASILLESQAGTAVTAADGSNIDICDLSDDPANPGSWTHEPQPGGNRIAIDPVLGRIAYSDPAPGETRLGSAHHGLAVEIGGGGYNRADSIGKIDSPSNVVSVSEGQSLIAPLNSVQTGGVVEIEDSWRYPVPPTITVNSSTGDDKITAVRSVNHAMPRLSRKTQVKLAMQPVTTVVFDGLAFQGAPLVVDEVADATVRTVILRHCTLVPGVRRNTDGTPWRSDRASLIILDPSVRVVLDHCIVGPIVAVEDSEVAANDSVIDASGPTRVAFAGRAPVGGGLRAVTRVADRQVGGGLEAGGQLTLQACTVIGKVHATRLDVSNSLLVAERSGPADPWPGPVWAERRQVGCMRFSYIPPGSRTPRQYRCVPRVDVPNGVLPHHTSLRFGDPGYVQLRRSNHEAIRTGADDESEMGVTHEQYQPQRETNLRLRLDEYLRFGLEAGLFYAN